MRKLTILATLVASAALAQTITSTCPVGLNPIATAINQTTGKVYSANLDSNSVTICLPDGTTKTLAVGAGPWQFAVDEAGGRIYVIAQYSAEISVIDAVVDTVLNTFQACPSRSGAVSIIFNPLKKHGAVSCEFDGAVAFFDGVTLSVIKTLTVTQPEQLSVNLATDTYYVSNETAASVTVIAGPGASTGGGGGSGNTGCGTGGTMSDSISLTPSNYWPTAGSQFTLTVQMSAGVTCGVVTFYDDSTVLGTGNVNAQGQASFTYTFPGGSHPYTAQFSGTSVYAPSTSSTVWN